MIVFLLLVIIAILLFGSAAVLGAFGKVLGFVAGVLALFFGIYWLSTGVGVSVDDMLLYICLAILPIAVIAGLRSTFRTPPTSSGITRADPTRHHGKWDRPGDFDGRH